MNGMPVAAEYPSVADAAPARTILINVPRRTSLTWLMGLYVFFFPIQFEGSTINLAPSDLFLGAALLCCFLRLRFKRPVWSIAHMALLLMFLVAAGTSIYLHGAMSSYVEVKIVGLFALFASYLCLTTVATSWREIRSLIRIFIVAASIHCLIAVVAFEMGASMSWMNYGHNRVSGMYLDPNAFGGLVLVALLLQIGSYLGGRVAVPGIIGIVLTASLAAGLFLTLSRSAWIGFTFGFILISFLRPRVWVIATFLILASIGGTYLWIASQRSARDEVLLERQNTAMQRIDQIRQAIPMFSGRPVFGIGLGEFDLRSNPAGYHPMIIHNTTVWILTELGLVGLSVYLVFVAWFFRRGWIALRLAGEHAKPLIVGLLGAHAGMLGISTGIEVLYQRHWWMVMALLASSAVIATRDLAYRRDAEYDF